MKKILLLLLIATSVSYAQEETNETYTDTSDYITFNPLAMFNYDTPRYRFGYTKSIKERWKASLDLGYGSDAISFSFDPSRDSEDYQLIDIRLETYYLFKVREKASDYISFELFYINHQETFIDDYYFINDRFNRIRYDRTDYNRNKMGANVKVGSFLKIWDKIGLNIYAGFGVRVRDNSFTNVINPRPVPPEDINDDSYFPSTTNFIRQDGTRVGFNVTLGMKIYYKLN